MTKWWQAWRKVFIVSAYFDLFLRFLRQVRFRLFFVAWFKLLSPSIATTCPFRIVTFVVVGSISVSKPSLLSIVRVDRCVALRKHLCCVWRLSKNSNSGYSLTFNPSTRNATDVGIARSVLHGFECNSTSKPPL